MLITRTAARDKIMDTLKISQAQAYNYLKNKNLIVAARQKGSTAYYSTDDVNKLINIMLGDEAAAAIEEKEISIEKSEISLEAKETEIKGLKEQIRLLESNLDYFNEELTKREAGLKEELKAKDNQIIDLSSQLHNVQALLEVKETKLLSLTEELTVKEKERKEAEKLLLDKEGEVTRLKIILEETSKAHSEAIAAKEKEAVNRINEVLLMNEMAETELAMTVTASARQQEKIRSLEKEVKEFKEAGFLKKLKLLFV